MAKKGYTFEYEMDKSLGLMWDYHFRIPDARTMRGYGIMQTSKVPSDFCGCKDGLFHLLECKQTKERSIRYSRLADHQEEALNKVNSVGGIGLIAVNFHNGERTKLKKIDRTFLLDVAQWSLFKDLNPNRKSITMDYFINRGKELILKRVGKSRLWVV